MISCVKVRVKEHCAESGSGLVGRLTLRPV